MDLFVFSSNRALHNFYQSSDEVFLPEAENIKNFFQNIIIVKDKVKIPNTLRCVLLWSIVQHIDIEKIGFDKAFLRFLDNSTFLLRFFDELESSMVNLKDIDISDTYGDYEDHLRIINKIYDAYKLELDRLHLYDIEVDFSLYSAYLQYYDNIHIAIDGILSKKDFFILQNACKYTNINISFTYDKYNAFVFDEILNVQLEYDNKYTYNVNNNAITAYTRLDNSIGDVTIYSFDMRINQAMLVIAKVNEWLSEGISDIVVILPDDSFVPYLEIFDKARNLNYAMGLRDRIYKRYLDELLKKLENNPETNKLEHILRELKEVNRYLFDIAFEFRNFNYLFTSLSYSEILEFLFNNAPKKDDVNGGKVKVIGVLESRGMQFSRAIIVDFNEEFIPKINDNDMFLNTHIRKKVKMPTLKDKENLQRHYYYHLIKNTKEIAISFCANKPHSSFLDDLAMTYNSINLENVINGEYLWRFFPIQHNDKTYIKDEFLLESSLKSYPLSPSKLKILANCTLQFYFLYIQQLQYNDNEESSATLGSIIHDILRSSDFTDIQSTIRNVVTNSSMKISMRLDLEVAGQRLYRVALTQRKILSGTRRILHTEYPIYADIAGFAINGRIDRVDKDEKRLFIIDYKYKKNFDPKNETFLQLFIYKSVLQQQYQDYEIITSYYDLYENKEYFMDDINANKAKEMLESALNWLKNDKLIFDKTDDKSICKYCDYKYLCDRF